MSAARPESEASASDWATFWRLARLAAPFGPQMGLAAALGLATVLSAVGLMGASAFIIATAALRPSIAALQVAIVGVRFFGLSRGIFRYLERLTAHQVTFRLLARLRVWFYAALEPLAPARLLAYRSGDLLGRILSDIETLENFYVRALAPPLVALLTAAVMALFMRQYAGELALTLLAALAVAGIGLPLWAGRQGRAPGAAVVAARAAFQTAAVDDLQGLADLLAYGAEAQQLVRLERANRDLAAAGRRLVRLNAAQTALSGLLAHGGMWAVLLVGIAAVERGQISGVDLAVVTLAALTSFEAVTPLPAAAAQMARNLAAARRLFAIVDAVPAVVAPAAPAPLPLGRTLELDGVGFTYPGEGTAALTDFALTLEPGRRVALVGASGAGKSTVARLLLRYWEPDAGAIRLGGVDVRTLDPEALRAQLAVVAQDTYLFNASLRQNLLLARPEADETALWAALAAAQLTDLARSLPQGLDTPLGESGLSLSGGERQRVAIARAALRDAPILILDEATANLDPLTETAVWQALAPLLARRAALVITHRLLGLETADEIVVLAAGRVIERGRHAELLAAGGPYARMWAIQQNRLVG